MYVVINGSVVLLFCWLQNASRQRRRKNKVSMDVRSMYGGEEVRADYGECAYEVVRRERNVYVCRNYLLWEYV